MAIRALYPGSFDPITYGHLNIIERAVEVFDEVVVAVAFNSRKTTLFTREERLELLGEVFGGQPKVRIETFEGLLVDYARSKDCKAIVRGLRTISDFEYEFQMAQANKTMAPDVETFFMMTDQRFSYFSSSLIKEIAMLGGDVDKMVPPQVAKRIRQKFPARA
ncbi:MAG: pantetheine-phosphate adenylyltransferase [Candidatus Methylomirabilis sp.]|nr:pantetheine-phosphate adenylyltransferase [Deltaproteobacteria bacterium]